MYRFNVSSEYGALEASAEAAVVVVGSIATFSADASERFRWRRAHSSSHFGGMADADGGLERSRDALHRFSCFRRPQAQVIVTVDWQGVFS